MASSGQAATGYYDNSYFYVNWQQASQSVANNSTTINWQLGIVSGSYWYSNAVNVGTIYINGSAVFGGGTWSNIYKETRQLASGSITIPHNEDGTKTFNINFTASLYGSSTMSANQNFTLNKINRYAVTNSATGSNIEENFSVDYTKYVSSYTYKLRISRPGIEALETINYPTSGTTFTLSKETIERLFDVYPDTNTFNLGFAIETWNGSTKLSAGNEKIISCTKTDRIGRLRINGEWKRSVPYVRINGEWVKAIPYTRINNEWKRGR